MLFLKPELSFNASDKDINHGVIIQHLWVVKRSPCSSPPPTVAAAPCQSLYIDAHIGRSLILVNFSMSLPCRSSMGSFPGRGLFCLCLISCMDHRTVLLHCQILCYFYASGKSSMYLCYLLKSRILEYKKTTTTQWQSTSVYRLPTCTHNKDIPDYSICTQS